MPVLPNARHERFAQGLAAGMTAGSAYVAAGYRENDGNAATLKGKQSILDRVNEILGPAAETIQGDVIETLTLKQRLAQALYAKALEALPGLAIEAAPEVKALIDSGIAIDKDERLLAGGANPDAPNVTINVVNVEVDDVFRRVRPAIDHQPAIVDVTPSAENTPIPTRGD